MFDFFEGLLDTWLPRLPPLDDEGDAKSKDTATRDHGELEGIQLDITEFTFTRRDVRPVQNDVVEALDAALERFGEVEHFFDPKRLLLFDAGGPAVYSVGVVRVEAATPYWLFLTYGFSHAVTPIEQRRGLDHELSIALPVDTPEALVWGPALLRHLARYVLESRRLLKPYDLNTSDFPITRFPFQLEHHMLLPDTQQKAILIAEDPALGTLPTPAGPIEVRRLIGLLPEEAELVSGRATARGLLEVLRSVDPDLLTAIDRPSCLGSGRGQAFRAWAEAERLEAGSLTLPVRWHRSTDGKLELRLPGGNEGARLLREVVHRFDRGKTVEVTGADGRSALRFVPGPGFAFEVHDHVLQITSNLDERVFLQLLDLPEEEGSAKQISYWIEPA